MKGQYFTIDAFVALLILATSIFVLLGVYISHPQTEPIQILGQELMATLENTRVRDLNHPFIRAQIKGGNITNLDNTLLQQTLIFHKKQATLYANIPFASYLLSNVTAILVPKQFGYRIIVDGAILDQRGPLPVAPEILITNKRVVFGYVEKSNDFVGPSVAEVWVWQ